MAKRSSLHPVALAALLPVLAGCAVRRGAGDASPRPSPSSDRGAQEREVYGAVLRAVAAQPDVGALVVDPELPAVGPGDIAVVSGRLSQVRGDTRADYLARTETRRLPADLDPGVPVSRLSAAEFRAMPLPAGTDANGENTARWQEFHRRYGASAAWIRLSQVGFSGDGTEAVVHVWTAGSSLGGGGALVVLRRERGAWVVRRRAATAIS